MFAWVFPCTAQHNILDLTLYEKFRKRGGFSPWGFANTPCVARKAEEFHGQGKLIIAGAVFQAFPRQNKAPAFWKSRETKDTGNDTSYE
ncbi:hypothetical protein UVI_02043010 [Ustilaginoidea virens]|uniref:Uncharacterized protein n=1 Tax=Ustilaginoidea virens TaxID=1159556 RepID=A0A1B5L3I5_USTVR|nr:hypothetical protein UVI_02043010 [Ustilaginoidea virens]